MRRVLTSSIVCVALLFCRSVFPSTDFFTRSETGPLVNFIYQERVPTMEEFGVRAEFCYRGKHFVGLQYFNGSFSM